MNGAFIRALSLDELFALCNDYWPPEAADYSQDYRRAVLALVQERLKYLAELLELTSFFFTDLPINPELISGHKQLKKLSTQELRNLLEQAQATLEASEFTVEDLQARLNDLLEKSGQKPAVLFSLVRIATTQAPSSPGLAESLAVLGKEVALRRIHAQLSSL